MNRPLATAALVAVLTAGAGPASARAQQGTAGSALALVVGGGGAFAVSQPGFDRSTGAAFIAGLEISQPWRAGAAGRLGLLLEGGYASQDLSSSPTVSGDVQTVTGAALLRVAVTPRTRLGAYLLAGPVWARPSTRIVLNATGGQVPGAGFEQTTHETAPGVLLGVGAGWQVDAATVRVEARWMSLATANKSTTMVPVILTVAVPLHR